MKTKSDDSLSMYLSEISNIPLLTNEQEDIIARKAVNGDKDAQAVLVQSNLKFVVTIAKKFQNQGLPLEDLLSEGNIGLLNAIDRYNPEKGYRFISYAVWWIRQAILKAIYEKSRMIRLPVNRANELVQIEKLKKAMLVEFGEEPTDDEIAGQTGIDIDDVRIIQAIGRDIVSLESPVYDSGKQSTLGNFILDLSRLTPDEEAINNSLKEEIEAVLKTLTKKEEEVLRYRYGLGHSRALSLRELGKKFQLTKERIRQIEKKALKRLRHPSRAQLLKIYAAA
ncbi:MAG: RNA polymerase subunit sigma [Spirochaeta sp. LUC14_002_19_P3]|nr:MAG: RNA polymerase subunit sigma [Spirochaeta sp. LUC14_002_19_P3]